MNSSRDRGDSDKGDPKQPRGQGSEREGLPPPRLSPWYLFLWLSALIVVLFFWGEGAQHIQARDLAYSEFRQAVARDHIRNVTIEGQRISGQFTQAGVEAHGDEQGGEQQLREFRTLAPPMEDRQLLELLTSHGVTVTAEPTEPLWWQELLANVVPWILLLALLFGVWYYAAQRLMGQGGQGPGGMFGFGKSKARRFREERPQVTMRDVAGVEAAKRDLQEVVDFLVNPEKYRALGAKIPKGLLMVGPPGTGKTLLARAVAGEAGVTFYSISGSEFIEMFVGVGAARVRDLFKRARDEAPALIFIDELDSVGRSRGTGVGGGHDEREQTLNQILAEMDGFEPHESVVVLAATNRPDVLDAALLRPGRFDRKVVLERPHRDARKAILEVHVRKRPLADDVNLDQLAARTIGFSGADLENMVNEAALLAARQERKQVTMACFDAARDRIIMGERREGKLEQEERELVAYHECGHALAAYYLPHADPLDKITVIPRGHALGLTEQTPREERYNLNESYLKDRIRIMLGGRMAERVVYREVSSGAQNDLKEATKLARRMVAQWGMSEKLGPVGLTMGEEHVFLGREMAQNRDYSERLAEQVDEEVQKLLINLERDTEELLRQHRKELEALAKAVLERETLSADEIEAVLKQQQTPHATHHQG